LAESLLRWTLSYGGIGTQRVRVFLRQLGDEESDRGDSQKGETVMTNLATKER